MYCYTIIGTQIVSSAPGPPSASVLLRGLRLWLVLEPWWVWLVLGWLRGWCASLLCSAGQLQWLPWHVLHGYGGGPDTRYWRPVVCAVKVVWAPTCVNPPVRGGGGGRMQGL